jgi:hypothetical protein
VSRKSDGVIESCGAEAPRIERRLAELQVAAIVKFLELPRSGRVALRRFASLCVSKKSGRSLNGDSPVARRRSRI